VKESAVVGRRLSFIAILGCAVVVASCGGNSVPAVKACLQRAGFQVRQDPTSVPLPTGKGEEPLQPGLVGALTVDTGHYFVWIWDSQRRARSFAKARGLPNGFDVFGTAVAGPFIPGGSAPPLPSIGTSKADRAKIDSCLHLARA
jgi:hypothetical protein